MSSQKLPGRLAGFDKQVARRIIAFMRDRIAALEDPRSVGEALHGAKLGEFWKYRVGDYRVISQIEDAAVRISGGADWQSS